MIHESFTRQLTTTMSTMVRSMVSAEIASVDQFAYDEFVRSLVQPTVIGILEMYPFSGNALIEINPNLVFAIIDRMLGGKGEFSGKVRELTDIERTVVERVIMRMLELLEESWSTVVDVRFRYENLESNPFFVQICPGTDMVLLVILKLKVGDVEGMVSICIPYFLMEPIIDKLSSQQWFASTGRKSDEASRDYILRHMQHVRLPLALELGIRCSRGRRHAAQDGRRDQARRDPERSSERPYRQPRQVQGRTGFGKRQICRGNFGNYPGRG
jgi:flagellar motor switch protein FliM